MASKLANAAATGTCELFYWRDRNREVDFVIREVDFVIRAGRMLVAIEVKSGRAPATLPGLTAFADAFRPQRSVLVGGDGIPVEEFLSRSVEHWLQP